MEQRVKALGVGGHHLAVVLRQLGEQEEAEHAAFAVAAKRHASSLGRARQARDQLLGLAGQRVIKAGLADLAQCGQAAGGGNRVARQGASLVDRAQGRHVFHDGALGAKSGQRHAPANDLAHDRDVGRKAGNRFGVHALRAAQGHAKAGHHLVQHQERSVFGAQFAGAAHKGRGGAHKVHIAGNRLNHHASQLFAVQHKGFFKLRQVVEFEHQRVLHHFGRHARAGGVAKGGQARAGFDQERVRVAVVAALKLDELAAPGGATRQADGAHGRFGARADQAHHVHAGHVFQDLFGQFHLALGGRAKRKALGQRFLHRVYHRRVAVAQNHRAPGADVVGIALAVGVPHIGALGAADKARRAAYGLKGAHRRVDAAGNNGAGAGKEFDIAVSGGFHWRLFQKERVHRMLQSLRRRLRGGPKTGGRAAHGPCRGESRLPGCGRGSSGLRSRPR